MPGKPTPLYLNIYMTYSISNKPFCYINIFLTMLEKIRMPQITFCL